MEKLSPEDISKAREWMAGNWPLLGGITFAPEEIVVLTIGCISEAVAAYSAAENERLTKERDALRDENYHLRHAPRGCSFCGELQGHKQTCWTVGTLLALEAAEAKCDRLKGAPARSGEPSAPPACPECKTQLRDETAWYRCNTCHARYSSSMERGLYRLPDDHVSAPQTSTVTKQAATCNCYSDPIPHTHAAPQTSAERQFTVSYEVLHKIWQAVGSVPQGVNPLCAGVYELNRDAFTALEKLFITAAPQPVSGDAPPKCPNEILRELMQELHYTLDMGGKLSLPTQIKMQQADIYLNKLAGDAPKVEEIARQLSQKFGFHSSRVLTYEGALGFLRPYFPPASQTPPISEHVLNEIVLAICEIPDRTSPDDFPEAMIVTPEELRFIIRDKFEQAATPASTAQPAAPSLEECARAICEALAKTKSNTHWMALVKSILAPYFAGAVGQPPQAPVPQWEPSKCPECGTPTTPQMACPNNNCCQAFDVVGASSPPQGWLQRGQAVYVSHPRFHGYGIVQYDTGARKRVIGVLLGNGNTWEYEAETVRIAAKEEYDEMPKLIREQVELPAPPSTQTVKEEAQ